MFGINPARSYHLINIILFPSKAVKIKKWSTPGYNIKRVLWYNFLDIGTQISKSKVQNCTMVLLFHSSLYVIPNSIYILNITI